MIQHRANGSLLYPSLQGTESRREVWFLASIREAQAVLATFMTGIVFTRSVQRCICASSLAS